MSLDVIKAIIFDLGGVYFSNGAVIAHKKLLQEFPDLSPGMINLVMKGKLGKDYRLGKFTKKEFWQKAQNLAGRKFDTKKFARIWNSSYQLNPDVAELVLNLRKNYKVGALSGNIRERIDYLEQKYNFKKDFEVIVLSYLLGVNKPSLKMYQEILRRLNLEGEECIFIDDQKIKLKPAEELGMKTILFQSVSQLRRELNELGVCC